jgi:dihydroorotase
MKQTILIRNVQLVQDVITSRCDVLIQNGKITKFGVDLIDSANLVIDGTRLTALPGLFDMHVHLRDPGQTHKEDIFTGTRAALAGGITGVACMPNTTPAIDSVETVRYILDKSAQTGVAVHPVGCITKGMKGAELCDFATLKEAGVCAVSDDGRPVACGERMREALCKAAAQNLPVISHCEDLSIIDGGIVNEGLASETLAVKGMDRTSEDSITARELVLAAGTGTPIHIAHVSTKGSVEMIRHAKKLGVKVTSETCPHYFLMTEEAVLGRDADYRMNPPLRTEEDRKAVLEGLLDGTIDCIVTDHAPHAPMEKADFDHAPNGVIGMETSLAASLKLVHSGLMTLPQLVEKMAFNPRRILGLPQVRLQVGEVANLTLVDLSYAWTVDPEKLQSKARNAVWKGQTLVGKPIYTITDGVLRYQDSEYLSLQKKG